MKKIITLLILMCSLGVMAQEYTPLVREGVKWECVSEQIGWWEMDPVPFSIYFKGDTIVNDIEYKKCYIESDTAKFVAALMREDVAAKQVFVCYPESLFGDTYNARIHIHILDHFKSHQDLEKEYVLYDFNNIYNSAMIAEWKSVTNITDESFISVGDKQCKRTRVANNSSANSNTQSAFFSLVEGVGFVSEIHNEFVYAKTNRCIYEGIMLDFLSYDQTNDGWEMITYFNRLVADDGTVLYESPNTYTPLVREGVKWNCKMVEDIDWGTKPDKITNYYIEFKGDTIIGDNTYKKCYYVFEDNRSLNTVPYAFLREDIVAKQVFVIYTSAYNGYVTSGGAYEKDIEELLYDFNDITNKNQRWAREFQELKTTTINAANEKYVVHTLYRWQGDVPCMYIAEGIGSVYNIKSPSELLHPYQAVLTCDCNTLVEFVSFENEKGEIVFDANTLGLEEIKIAPQINVYYDGRCITVNAESVESIEIFDLQGRTVSNVSRSVVVDCGNIASGIYIIKVVTDRGVITQKVEI